ncbi:unnamed protein product [Durusdinium trenchii]|uniref:Uncharacterized protein n=1 Tax=Durusdinium trenchii TaxID=1381693 RepID=A0ABP0PGQ6_9DINO
MIGLHVEVPQKPELPLMGSSQIAEVKSSLQPLVESLDEEVSFPQGDGLWTQQFALELLPFRNSFSSETEYSEDEPHPGSPNGRTHQEPPCWEPRCAAVPRRKARCSEWRLHLSWMGKDYLAYLDTARHFIEQDGCPAVWTVNSPNATSSRNRKASNTLWRSAERQMPRRMPMLREGSRGSSAT